MSNEKFASGAFVFARARGIEPRLPEDLLPLTAQHGIPTDFIPAYAGDRTAIGRAISQASAGLQREGFLLRPITRTTSQVVYGVVKEDRDEARQKLDHEFEGLISWASEPDPALVHGEHPIARRVAEAYRDLRGKITADDWSSAISAYLEHRHAARVRGDGRVYWVPPGEPLEAVRGLGSFLAQVGIDLVLCEIEGDSRAVVEAVAGESLDDQISALEREASDFDGTQKPTTYRRRLAQYERLRERAVLYRDALGLGVERAYQVLSELERKVGTMLDLRRETVIHRERVAASGERTSPSSSLRFAGVTFTAVEADDDLCFVSDDERAKATVEALERMGLAGSWQQAGAYLVAIKHSGPPGAAVSIRVRIPDGLALESGRTALAALGIEVACASA